MKPQFHASIVSTGTNYLHRIRAGHFDLSTDEGLDGFDFLTDAQNLRFRLLMDGKERPELVYVGLTGTNPRTLPFAVPNPDAKPRNRTIRTRRCR